MGESLTERCRVEELRTPVRKLLLLGANPERANWRDCRRKPEEGEDDVKSACPLRLGLHTCYNGRDNGTLTKRALTPNSALVRIAG